MCARSSRDELRADVAVFPELALTGYPPEDLLLRPDLHAQVREGIEELKRGINGIAAVFGYPHQEDHRLYNAAALLRDDVILARYFKQHLPNYGVFDEKRYFVAGDRACVVDIEGVPTALSICEDIWMPGPIRQAREAGARLLININASPFHLAKGEERVALLRQRAQQGEMPIVYFNLVGGQDELVFDGESLAVDAEGQLMLRAPAFAEGLFPLDLQVNGNVVVQPGERRAPLSEEQSAYQALVLGVRDYVNKNGFNGVVIGVSGGIDSALTLAVAVDALGAERVEAVLMPSRYTAPISIEDGKAVAEALGVKHSLISIEPSFQAFLDSLKQEFAGLPADVTEENIQARCRGVVLMAIANKKRNIVLSTGNKSEMSVGYATLYGDMAGGFAPLKDVPKLLVYRLAEYRNRIQPVIPRRVFERAPTAELA
ncbi:MAG: NAD+ synthase, partial [Gammaproteobacteria bacterium]